MYFLERLIDSSRKERIPLTGNKVTIGRSVDCSIKILSPMVSRCHAVLTFENNQWIIRDVKSINGIYVNNTRLQTEGTCSLTDNDIVSLGPPERTQFRYCFCKHTAETDTASENERACKIKKRDRFQDTSEICTEKNSGNLLTPENVENHEIDLHIGAEYTVSNNCNKEANLIESEILCNNKLILSEVDSVLYKSECENLEGNIKRTEDSQITSEKTSTTDLNPSSSETNSENLKQTIETLQQLLASKEKEQEELQDKLLRAEAQLIENSCESEAKQEDDKKSIQERIKTDILKEVGDIMETELICGVCTELFIEATTLNCSHTFCKFCIQKWKKKKRICPICRANIKTETQALVLENFIEKMVENLSTEMKEHRKKLIEERRISPSSSSTNSTRRSKTYIVISDIDSDESYDSDFDPDTDLSDSSVEGRPWSYYGGSGRCYTCGRRGHWANGCPDTYG